MTSYACLARCWCRNTRTLTIGKTWLGLEVPGNGRIVAGSSRGSGTGRSGVKSLSVDAGKSKDSDAGNCNEVRLTTMRSVDQDGGLKKSTFNISRSSSSSPPCVSVLLLFVRRNCPVAFFLPQLPYATMGAYIICFITLLSLVTRYSANFPIEIAYMRTFH